MRAAASRDRLPDRDTRRGIVAWVAQVYVFAPAPWRDYAAVDHIRSEETRMTIAPDPTSNYWEGLR